MSCPVGRRGQLCNNKSNNEIQDTKKAKHNQVFGSKILCMKFYYTTNIQSQYLFGAGDVTDVGAI